MFDNYHTKLTQQSARSSKLLYANVALFSVGLFSNRSQESSNMARTLLTHSTATFLFIPHFHVIYGLVLNRSKETWNLLTNFMGISFIFMFGCICKGRWNIFTRTMQVTHYYYYYYCVNMKESSQ